MLHNMVVKSHILVLKMLEQIWFLEIFLNDVDITHHVFFYLIVKEWHYLRVLCDRFTWTGLVDVNVKKAFVNWTIYYNLVVSLYTLNHLVVFVRRLIPWYTISFSEALEVLFNWLANACWTTSIWSLLLIL